MFSLLFLLLRFSIFILIMLSLSWIETLRLLIYLLRGGLIIMWLYDRFLFLLFFFLLKKWIHSIMLLYDLFIFLFHELFDKLLILINHKETIPKLFSFILRRKTKFIRSLLYLDYQCKMVPSDFSVLVLTYILDVLKHIIATWKQLH
jgi:hypothetical protein